MYVVYYSGTGNTERMAKAVAEGMKDAGAEVNVVEFDEVKPEVLAGEAAFALGCPAMGDEVLEECIVEPFIEALESSVHGKKMVLFGSYDWGDGQWMRDWVERMEKAGAAVVGGEGIIANNEPDEEALEACKAAGKTLLA